VAGAVVGILRLNRLLGALPAVPDAPWRWLDGPTLQALLAFPQRALLRADPATRPGPGPYPPAAGPPVGGSENCSPSHRCTIASKARIRRNKSEGDCRRRGCFVSCWIPRYRHPCPSSVAMLSLVIHSTPPPNGLARGQPQLPPRLSYVLDVSRRCSGGRAPMASYLFWYTSSILSNHLNTFK